MSFESVSLDLAEIHRVFHAIDEYLSRPETRSPEVTTTDLGTDFTHFSSPLSSHYAQLHSDQAAHIAALRSACAAAYQDVLRFAAHDADLAATLQREGF